jgi:hypothetical protein
LSGSVRLESRLAVSGLTPFAGNGAMNQVIKRVRAPLRCA